MQGMLGEYSNDKNWERYYKGCINLKELNLSSSFYIKEMFSGCSNLKELNLPSSFYIKNVTNMQDMFSCCKNLKELIKLIFFF